MFLLNLLPMWVFQAVAASLVVIGIALYLFVRHPVVPNFVPRLLGAFLFAAGVFITGGLWTQKEYLAEVEKFKEEVARKEQESVEVTEKIVTKYKDKIVVVKERGDVIVQKVPEYITKESDAKCDVPNGFVVLHDSASKNEVPKTSSSTNGEPSGVALSQVATTVAGNYTTCHETREQLKSLQEWIKEQEKIYNRN